MTIFTTTCNLLCIQPHPLTIMHLSLTFVLWLMFEQAFFMTWITSFLNKRQNLWLLYCDSNVLFLGGFLLFIYIKW